MEVMRPIASVDMPSQKDFVYEVKYDGFRAVLHWDKQRIRIISRNQKDLTDNFPEIIDFCLEKQILIEPLLPLTLDGELVILNNCYQANFSLIQKRGRLKKTEKIRQEANQRPATFLAFDLLREKGSDHTNKHFEERKKRLKNLFNKAGIKDSFRQALINVEVFNSPNELKRLVFEYKGEGIVAKRKKSHYQPGKSHQDWFKIKNWRTVQGFLTQYNPKNGYFSVAVLDSETIVEIGKCKHGLDEESLTALKQVFRSQGTKTNDGYTLPPAICASIYTLDLLQGELREPEFAELLPNISPVECTIEQLQLDGAMIPTSFELTNTSKVFWPEKELTKGDLLVYMRDVSPYMLPFLKQKALTIIRYPDGVTEEGFFQKSLPGYAPDFIKSIPTEDKQVMLCDNLDSLMWFANHGAVEYHVPFQTVDKETYPAEIAFDLDPPDRGQFELAIQAALLIKKLLDDLQLTSFIKTSGNKGLQIHIPIPNESMTYDETAIFTQAIAFTIENEHPNLFTTERLKKKRKGRLYIDYIQHGKDKTLIAPYSPRKTDEATVAAPLFWEEVTQDLRPVTFTIDNVVSRVQTLGCPFASYFEAGKNQSINQILKLVKR